MILNLDDIKAAHKRIENLVRWTPLLESPLLSQKFGRGIYVKCDNLQVTGSFKMRGASHRISKLSDVELQKGVVAYSSGNHAQAVSAAAFLRGCRADIVMPRDSPMNKVESTRAWGGVVHFYDRNSESREERAAELLANTGGILVPPYDDIDVIAGQGTLGYEVAMDCQRLGIVPSSVIVPCGGGGLTAGSCIAIKSIFECCKMFISEPVGYGDTLASLRGGVRVAADRRGSELCDSLLTPISGELTFPIMQELVDGGFLVDDGAISLGLTEAFRYFRLIVEAGGVAAFAAFLENHAELPDGDVILVFSGGNIDEVLYKKLLSESL